MADEAEAAVAPGDCWAGNEHHWSSRHAPGHIVYWLRLCTICHEPDWDDLDREVRLGVGKLLGDPGQNTATIPKRNPEQG